MTKETAKKRLNESFGSYRAEWLLKGKIFELFTEPSYFTALQDIRPCVLEGGRGTGKTTVLRGLSYHGQYALHENKISEFDNTNFVGIYHRVDTNHSRAFTGADVSEEQWMKLFGHYFNLVFCREILRFLKWHNELDKSDDVLSPHICQLIARSINIDRDCSSQDQLIELVDLAMYEFQSKINTISDEDIPPLSILGDPIKALTEHVSNLPQFEDKIIFIMLDEYENYMDYQQKLINTLIKHSTEHFSFKIGVRELGWRVKHTLNSDELLHDPADYVLFNLEHKLVHESHFSDFAKSVCQQRIQQVIIDEISSSQYNIEQAFGTLSIEDEAEILGVEQTSYWASFMAVQPKSKKKVKNLPKMYLFFIAYWAKWHEMSIEAAIIDYLNSPEKWDTRYDNYKYNTLFKIRKGRGKRGIQKYYSGWQTYVKLANGNIRYLMELVYRALNKHIEEGEDLNGVISHKNQTLAAQEVGLKNLSQLEGLKKNGAQLTKLLLGLGRVFQVLASTEGNIAPEKNQFSIENSEGISEECLDLINGAVMNLALVRSTGNKLNKATHTRDYIYSIHPVFAAFFVFSFRKKRKIVLRQQELLGFISNPKPTIKSVLLKSKIPDLEEQQALPSQMSLFERYYND